MPHMPQHLLTSRMCACPAICCCACLLCPAACVCSACDCADQSFMLLPRTRPQQHQGTGIGRGVSGTHHQQEQQQPSCSMWGDTFGVAAQQKLLVLAALCACLALCNRQSLQEACPMFGHSTTDSGARYTALKTPHSRRMCTHTRTKPRTTPLQCQHQRRCYSLCCMLAVTPDPTAAARLLLLLLPRPSKAPQSPAGATASADAAQKSRPPSRAASASACTRPWYM